MGREGDERGNNSDTKACPDSDSAVTCWADREIVKLRVVHTYRYDRETRVRNNKDGDWAFTASTARHCKKTQYGYIHTYGNDTFLSGLPPQVSS